MLKVILMPYEEEAQAKDKKWLLIRSRESNTFYHPVFLTDENGLIAIGLKRENSVKWVIPSELLEHYVFDDGTPCGIVKLLDDEDIADLEKDGTYFEVYSRV